ncbi:leucine-rich repeat domain-containing protein [Alkalibacillus haloalkaliphilus]|uniref:Internalin-A n=1 Tax=Alkalibacillus haloalkaliphilus TaxID=94136 RepID=A0A511W3S3_9BACI|nr:leucine-rich repeat domain-containing protein [Alkalibacillus haloalkaliphilus]GEN45607.1 hypothetical protein AHA02nite_13830 [Alkalibacillus haloalkaliphilus]
MKRLEDLARQDREKLNELKAPGNLEAKLTDALKERTHEDGTKRKRMHPLLHAAMVLFLLGGSSFLALSVIGNDSTDEEEETEDVVEEEEVINENEEVTFEDEVIEEAVRGELEIRTGEITKGDLNDLFQLNAGGEYTQSLGGLEHAPNLERLSIKLNDSIDLSILEGLPNLKDLYIGESDFDSSILHGLDQLEQLTINSTEIDDYSFLEGMTNLEVLGLRGTGLTSLEPVSHLENLKNLNIASTSIYNEEENELEEIYNYVDDLSPLSNLEELEVFSARKNQISDLTPLAELRNLRQIRVNKNRVDDLTPLQHLEQLEDLTLLNNEVEDVTPIINLPNLENLVLGDNNITDASPLGKLGTLTSLMLSNNEIEDVSFVEHLTNLTNFYAERNKISSFPDFNVEHDHHFFLNLSHNDIDTIDPEQLSSINNLYHLELEYNNLTDLSVFEHTNRLDLYLYGNDMNEMLRGHLKDSDFLENKDNTYLAENVRYNDVSHRHGNIASTDEFNNGSHTIYRLYRRNVSTFDIQVLNLDESEEKIYHSFTLDSGMEEPFRVNAEDEGLIDPFVEYDVLEDEMKVMVTLGEVAPLENFEGLEPGVYEWDLIEGEVNQVE